jgi:hypothetical protein
MKKLKGKYIASSFFVLCGIIILWVWFPVSPLFVFPAMVAFLGAIHILVAPVSLSK